MTLCLLFCILGRGGSAGAKFRISLGLPVGAVINCADNTGKKNFLTALYLGSLIISKPGQSVYRHMSWSNFGREQGIVLIGPCLEWFVP